MADDTQSKLIYVVIALLIINTLLLAGMYLRCGGRAGYCPLSFHKRGVYCPFSKKRIMKPMPPAAKRP